MPNNQLAPNLARQGIQHVPDARLRRDADGLQHGRPSRRRLHVGEGRAAAGDSASRSTPSRRSASSARARPFLRSRRSCRTPSASTRTYKSEGYNPRKARALLDLYGYVDRDGDGFREQPDGTPLVIEVATQPDQASRRLDELQRKDYTAIGIKAEFKQAKWPENLRSVRAGKFMLWRVGSSAASPDGQPALDRSATIHKGGQNLARFSNPQLDEMYSRLSVIPDGPEREHLFRESKRLIAAYAPYHNGVHRILTDLAWPWLTGFRRPPYWLAWWQYVDIDAEQQAGAIK